MPTQNGPAGDHRRTGLWLVGARGSVATTAAVGVLGLRAGLSTSRGCVSELPEVAVADLVPLAELVLGGHDVSDHSMVKQAERLAGGGVLPTALVDAVADDLAEVDRRVQPGLTRTDRAGAERVAADITAFRAAHDLDRVVVLDVSSTEPPPVDSPALATRAGFEAALAAGEPLPASSVYTYAAYATGSPVVSFTPSPGPRLPALVEMAEQERLPWAGSDGKTGETLMKSALAPMFATRDLRVRSWASYNMLGGGDGRTLSDDAARSSKTASKARGLETMLGHAVDGPLHIDYVPDLGDWKTAWDHVSFEGFLGTRMTLQFTWQGCDSALAAPLVLDLARLVARAHERGRVGPQPLGFFFKDPAGSDEHRLAAQWEHLVEWAAELGR